VIGYFSCPYLNRDSKWILKKQKRGMNKHSKQSDSKKIL
jgi:hypothetical protein